MVRQPRHPALDDGGGPAGTLVWSDENVTDSGISSHAIRELAREVFELQ